MINDYQVLPAEGVKTDFRNWNSMANSYGSKSYQPPREPAKRLVAAVIREFESFCKDYHIDSTQYRTIQPVHIEGEWRQFEFIDGNKQWPAKISVHSMVVSSVGYKILQRVIDIGR